MPTLSISLTDDNYSKLISLAKESGLNRSQIANKALSLYEKEYNKSQQEYLVAEKAWKEFEASGEKGTSLEDAKKEFGL